MEGKSVQGNGNNNKKNLLFDDPNTANTSFHEETQNTSQCTNAELNEKFESLLIKFNTMVKENSKIKESYSKVMEENSKILKNNSLLNKKNANLEIRMEYIEQRLDDFGSLLIRNNINADLLANRDTLKTVLLIFSYNLGVTKKEEMEKLGETNIYNGKFSNLLLKVFQKLDNELNPILRKDVSKNLSENDKKKIIKKFMFAECIHFIVCSLDNIIHPSIKEDNNSYSKLYGNRSKETLEKCIVQFFNNPKTIDELKVMIKILKEKDNLIFPIITEKNRIEENINNDKDEIIKVADNIQDKKEIEDENRIKKTDNDAKEKGFDDEKKNENDTEKRNSLNDKKEDIILEKGQNMEKEKEGDNLKSKDELINSKKDELKELYDQEIDLKEEKFINFDNYDESKNLAYLINKQHYENLNGKNNYKSEFFIQHLFKPNLSDFSKAKMKLNCEEFIDCINNEIKNFNSPKDGIKPLNLLKKLKWLSHY